MRVGRFCRGAAAVVAVALASTPAIASAPAGASDGRAPSRHASSAPPGGSSRYLVRWRDGDAAAEPLAEGSVAGARIERTTSRALHGALVEATPDQAEALRHDPAVASVEADAIVRASSGQDDPPWNLDRIDEQVNLGYPPGSGRYVYPNAGAGVSVYVMDSGIRSDHMELAGRVRDGYTTVEDGLGYQDCDGHGTHVAGTIGGTTVGVAKAVALVNVRVLDCNGEAYASDILEAADWILADHRAHPGPAVLNLSLGGSASVSIDAAMQALVDDGVTVVAAAGNDNADACGYSPGRLPSVITVGASHPADARAPFSNKGPCVDLWAPGVEIDSAWPTSATAFHTLSGTSMAAPHVAGAAAIVLAVDPSLAPGDVAYRLVDDATPNVVTDAGAGSPTGLLLVRNLDDVPSAYPFAPSITWMVSVGYANGNVDHTFHPLDAVSRQAMAAFLYRAGGAPYGPSPTCTSAPFDDVPIDAPFCGEIAWLTSSGIASGYDGNVFRPKEPVTRQAMAAFLFRVSQRKIPYLVPPPCTGRFVDVPVGAPFCGEIQHLVNEGITAGYADGGFHPASSVSRQAMASFLSKDSDIPHRV